MNADFSSLVGLPSSWELFETGLPNGGDNPAEHEEYDAVEAEFRNSIEQATQGLRKLNHQIANKSGNELRTAVMTFAQRIIAEWKPQRHKRTHDKRSILHLFAQEKGPAGTVGAEAKVYQAFVSLFLMSNLELMGWLDSEQRTPLSTAVKAKNYNFILACSMIPRAHRDLIRKELEAEVQDEDDGDETCLEMAVKKLGLPMDVRLELVRLSPKKAFVRTNKRGCTPLHLAVAYDKFEKRPAEQAALVRALLECGPEAMDIRTISPKGLSVYQYQEYTRSEKAELAQQAKNSTGRRGSLRPGPGQQPATTEIPSRARTPPVPVDFKADGVVRTKLENPDRKNTARDGPKTVSKNMEHTQAIVPMSPVVQAQTNGFASPDRHFDEIKEELKLWYLRNKNPVDAVRFLTIRGQKKKSFWFDFGRPRHSITEDEFETVFNHLSFDKCLSYVSFRRGEIKLGPKSSYADKSLRGRQDMLFLFGWLTRRGVERILSVIVEDDGLQAHSDEAIEKAIGSFKVEVLDWKKPDLDAGVLQRVGHHLREVHLQWSGNNSALRAWGGPCGLRAIPTLKKVYLYVCETLDSDERRNKNLNDFRTRLGANLKPDDFKRLFEAKRDDIKKLLEAKPDDFKRLVEAKPDHIHNLLGELLEAKRNQRTITLEIDESEVAAPMLGQGGETTGRGKNGIERGNSTKPGTGHTVYSYQWIKSMDDFVRIFRDIEPPLPAPGPGVPPKLLKRVVVALIDDGVDLPRHGSATDKFDGESLHTYEYGGRVWPWFNSAAGHGTTMARLIHRVCPNAVIYVIRLKTQTSEGDSSKIHVDPASAIEAIHRAVDEGVDIISMSWTCAPTTELQTAWENAIDAAARRSILMFCSASDRGRFGERTFPHSCRPTITLRVGAALPTGQVFDRVADASNLDFALPGYEVFLEEDPDRVDGPPDGLESHTGSSVATALAAGLAGLVLEIVRIGLAHDLTTGRTGDGTLVAEDLAFVRDRGTLRRIFLDRIGHSKDSAPNLDKFVVVDDVFGRYARMLAADGPEDQIETVATMARELLDKYSSGSRRDNPLSPLAL